jgi:hypothetical protein
MAIRRSDAESGSPAEPPTLLLVKSQSVKGRSRRAMDVPTPEPAMRLIDCRPNLLQLLGRGRRRVPFAELVERFLGRLAASAAAKLRR